MKKSIKLIFKIVAGALFLVVIVVSGMIMFLSFDRRDAFSIINADFTNYEYLKNSDLLRTSGTDKVALANRYNVYSHRLVEGSGIIIGYREYSNGSFFRIDDEYFSKLTIWIPELPKEFPETYNFSDVNSIKAIYTKGGSAWPGSACAGYITSGTLRLEKMGSKYSAETIGSVNVSGSIISSNKCKPRNIHLNFNYDQIQYSELTPWLGLEGNHPYQETYR